MSSTKDLTKGRKEEKKQVKEVSEVKNLKVESNKDEKQGLESNKDEKQGPESNKDEKQGPESNKDGKLELESNKFEVPLTLSERLKKLSIDEYVNRAPDDPKWFDKDYNRKQIDSASEGPFWAAPRDARYQQIRQTRHCFDYYVDYHRCLNLLGEDHKPCKFFYNVYKDICPSFWVAEFDEWREAGVFPARFDR